MAVSYNPRRRRYTGQLRHCPGRRTPRSTHSVQARTPPSWRSSPAARSSRAQWDARGGAHRVGRIGWGGAGWGGGMPTGTRKRGAPVHTRSRPSTRSPHRDCSMIVCTVASPCTRHPKRRRLSPRPCTLHSSACLSFHPRREARGRRSRCSRTPARSMRTKRPVHRRRRPLVRVRVRVRGRGRGRGRGRVRLWVRVRAFGRSGVRALGC